ncbi:zinc ribbon domain-containing protein [Herbaspirillum sp. CAH-3]|uniref:Adenylate cyclase n=1 Tax=Herbaspirillum robiniae TaxID=2014887 RepID=A0A246WQ28_9BURK|nr:zinc ribbon domain-containing protein [Herbaspirillum sp. CAH-3]OWY28492.1 adenylate cyclase [Herbaspirillum robiniae]
MASSFYNGVHVSFLRKIIGRHHGEKRRHGDTGHHGNNNQYGSSEHGGHSRYSPPPTGRGRSATPIGTSCPRCFTVSSPGARFCHECGSGLTAIACTQCGSGMPSGTKFCGQCGTSST